MKRTLSITFFVTFVVMTMCSEYLEPMPTVYSNDAAEFFALPSALLFLFTGLALAMIALFESLD